QCEPLFPERSGDADVGRDVSIVRRSVSDLVLCVLAPTPSDPRCGGSAGDLESCVEMVRRQAHNRRGCGACVGIADTQLSLGVVAPAFDDTRRLEQTAVELTTGDVDGAGAAHHGHHWRRAVALIAIAELTRVALAPTMHRALGQDRAAVLV